MRQVAGRALWLGNAGDLRDARAVQILERIGSDAARDLLRKLGEGNSKAPETLDAKRALDRLTTRNRRE